MKIFVACRRQRRKENERERAYHLSQERCFQCGKIPPKLLNKKINYGRNIKIN